MCRNDRRRVDLTDSANLALLYCFMHIYKYSTMNYVSGCSMVVFYTHLKKNTVECAFSMLIFGYFMPLLNAKFAYQRLA